MIRTEIQIVVLCDHCETGLTSDPDTSAGVPAVFADRLSALAAIDAAVRFGGWARRLGGRLLCPTCADRAWCLVHGHDYRDQHIPGPDGGTFREDGTYGWRVCGCERSIPAHADAVDPAGGAGCGMVWRLCGRCDHIDEHHATQHDATDHQLAEHGGVHQPGGFLRQDVPAGLADPHHPIHARQDAGRDGGDAAIVGAELGRWSR